MAFPCPYRFDDGKHEGGCDRLGTACPLNDEVM